MTEYQRIEEVLKFSGLSARALAMELKLKSPQIFYDIKAGKCGISKELATKIQDHFFNLSAAWLLTGEGEMLKNSSEGVAVVTENDGDVSNSVPLIPMAALANPLAEYIGNGVKRVDCEMVVSPVPGAEFAIQISGDSMEPKFPDGFFVFLKRINDELFIPWGNTMVLDTENGAYIKNVFPIKGRPDYIEARSINPLYPAFEVPKRAIFGMYRVLGMAKTFSMM